MTTIVMTYYQRLPQLLKTLESFKQYNPREFNVVIVDDCSPDDIKLPKYNFNVRILKLRNKKWANTSSVYNEGFLYALKRHPRIIIIQNAECCHIGDILEYTKKITDKNYISFGCYSLGKNDPFEIKNNRIAGFDGDNAWYNHPVYRPLGYHFCTAISTRNLIKLNGFDERFCDGIAYEDDYFIHRVRCLGLEIEITEYPFVFHQYHYDGLVRDPELINRNARLFAELSQSAEYRAIHTITPDL